jgi:hypothetical protein
VKKPQYKYMPQYSTSELYAVMNSIFEKACSFRGTESIVFNDFDWPGLYGQGKC